MSNPYSRQFLVPPIPFSRYKVSDGKMDTAATLTFIATEPFLRLENGKILVPDLKFGGVVPVCRTNLSAQTNLDEDISLIRYEIVENAKSPFMALENGLLRTVTTFLQKVTRRLSAQTLEKFKFWQNPINFAHLRTSMKTESSTTWIWDVHP